MTGRSRTKGQKELTWRHIRSVIPPEIQEALANNSLPTPGVLKTARAFRDDPAAFSDVSQTRIEEIDQQMEALQYERNLLADTQNAGAAMVRACVTVCAPIRRLPRDILHEIAIHALMMYPAPSKRQAPMALSHLSSAWRSVVLHAPHLWTDLYLKIKYLDPSNLSIYSQVVKTWFGRAGSLPINLYLYVDCEMGDDEDEELAYNFQVFLTAIAPWMPRVARLGIGGRFWLELMAQFADIDWDLPNLHTLELLGQQCNEEGCVPDGLQALRDVADRITMFNAAPNLTTLIANQEITTFSSSFSFLPWRALAHVILHEAWSSQSEALTLLTSQSPHLQSAHFCMFGGVSFTQAPKLVSKLKHLKIDILPTDWSYMPSFFSCFRFENLVNLEIAIDDSDGVSTEIPHQSNIVEVFPSLEVLRLDWGVLTPLTIQLLQMMPRLRVLITRLSYSSAAFNKLFDAMILSNSRPQIVPILEECWVTAPRESLPPILVDTSTLSRFIRSRTRPLPPGFANFKKLCLTGTFEFIENLNEVIARHRAETSLPAEVKHYPDILSPWHDSLHRVNLPTARFAEIEDGPFCVSMVGHNIFV